jgi:glutamate-1-semialdehyde 2,1-aminomutase
MKAAEMKPAAMKPAATSAPRNADLACALADAHERYTRRNPRSLARHVEATAVMPGGNTRTVLHYAPFPMAAASGKGCRIRSLDDATYIDFLGEYTAGLYGHSNPVIRRAIDAALDGGISLGAANPTEARFARVIADRFPAMERLRFTNSGTEANLMALATACAVTGRRGVLAFHGGYHGGVFTFLDGPGSAGSPTNAPFDFARVAYNDADAVRAAVAAAPDRFAAVIAEPMLGSGGCIPAEPAFLHALRAAARESGALLILDEVMTSRLAPGGLGAAHGITPDLMTLGKYVGGGMSFGAFGGRADLMDRFDPRRPDAFRHAGTFNNNVLTMSAGLAGLTEVFTPDAAAALAARGEALRARLNALCRAADAPMQFTGIGSMLAVHMTATPLRAPPAPDARAEKLRELFFFDLLERGIYIARRGMMTLSLPIGDAECDALAEAVAEFLSLRAPLLAAG